MVAAALQMMRCLNKGGGDYLDGCEAMWGLQMASGGLRRGLAGGLFILPPGRSTEVLGSCSLRADQSLSNIAKRYKRYKSIGGIMEIPLWVVASLGKRVALVDGFEGPCEAYPPMHEGILAGIQYDEVSNQCYTLVALDMNDLTYLENFDFSEIRPPHGPAVYVVNEKAESVVF